MGEAVSQVCTKQHSLDAGSLPPPAAWPGPACPSRYLRSLLYSSRVCERFRSPLQKTQFEPFRSVRAFVRVHRCSYEGFVQLPSVSSVPTYALFKAVGVKLSFLVLMRDRGCGESSVRSNYRSVVQSPQ
ncbi:hypothetical protein ZHAS_00011868 [Anopheles sinensis]|uniref:Uncharacterized protein n=1 Tax=Anopheles sinensis TaxID=74873 RepID=A0A084W1E4_ANOSI|nr:hypothetical protein ZHAS_00011868 [Anopheles sinensis]